MAIFYKKIVERLGANLQLWYQLAQLDNKIRFFLGKKCFCVLKLLAQSWLRAWKRLLHPIKNPAALL